MSESVWQSEILERSGLESESDILHTTPQHYLKVNFVLVYKFLHCVRLPYFPAKDATIL